MYVDTLPSKRWSLTGYPLSVGYEWWLPGLEHSKGGKMSKFTVEKLTDTTLTSWSSLTLAMISHLNSMNPLVWCAENGILLLWSSSQKPIISVESWENCLKTKLSKTRERLRNCHSFLLFQVQSVIFSPGCTLKRPGELSKIDEDT